MNGDTPQRAALARRSHLFVPANRPHFIQSATRRGADAVIVDLEDSVPTSELPSARDALSHAVKTISAANLDVYVRVNTEFDLLIEDLDAAVSARPRGLVLPKIDSALQVHIIDALVREREVRGGIDSGSLEFQVLIETCKGLTNVSSISEASPRTVSMSLGAEDLGSELEIEPGEAGSDLSWAHGRVLMAARAAGLAPYGLMSSLAKFSDLDALAEDVKRSRQFGYIGAFCIHPAQIPILNDGFSPSDAELTRACKVISALEQAERSGAHAVALNGQMIDVPVADRARQVLLRSQRDRRSTNLNPFTPTA